MTNDLPDIEDILNSIKDADTSLEGLKKHKNEEREESKEEMSGSPAPTNDVQENNVQENNVQTNQAQQNQAQQNQAQQNQAQQNQAQPKLSQPTKSQRPKTSVFKAIGGYKTSDMEQLWGNFLEYLQSDRRKEGKKDRMACRVDHEIVIALDECDINGCCRADIANAILHVFFDAFLPRLATFRKDRKSILDNVKPSRQ